MKKYGLAVQNAMVEKALMSADLVSSAVFIARTPEDLNILAFEHSDLDYIFFPHWSFIVPESVYSKIECICFHSSPLPYGRGGSPVQNMIKRGFDQTEICALRMTETLDGGPVYLRRTQSLEGPAHKIFAGIYANVADMIAEMIVSDLEPREQTGDPTYFKRLGRADNELPTEGSQKSLYDTIRMTDSELYPSAWLQHGQWLLEFSDAELDGDGITATVRIRKANDKSD